MTQDLSARIAFLEKQVAAARADALREAAEICTTYMHDVPANGGDELDRIARYSNSTAKRIQSAIRSLIPPQEK